MSPQGYEGGPEVAVPGGVVEREADTGVMHFEDRKAKSQDKVRSSCQQPKKGQGDRLSSWNLQEEPALRKC